MGYASFSNLPLSAYNELSSKVEDRVYFINDEGTIRLNEVTYGAGGDGSDSTDYLTLRAEQANSTIALNKNTDDPSLSAVLEYSTDGETWTNYEWSGTAGLVITLANVGDYVKFRGDNPTFSINANSLYYLFAITGSVGASGNINTLMSKNGNAVLTTYCFTYLFKQCTSLTSAPAFPATQLADYCYTGIFDGCTSLTTAPALPATQLANFCYAGMFYECTGLTSAPALPATQLVNYCYQGMFSGCTLLNHIEVAFTGWNSRITDWLKNVSASGKFYCPYGLPIIRDESHIPAGWNVVYTDVPESVLSGAAAATEALTMING